PAARLFLGRITHRSFPAASISSSFFFQAEDGIRDFHVTGVQTCALPIFSQLLHEMTCYTGRQGDDRRCLCKLRRESQLTIERGEIGRASGRESAASALRATNGNEASRA